MGIERDPVKVLLEACDHSEEYPGLGTEIRLARALRIAVEALKVIREKAGTHTIAAHPYYSKPTDDPSFGGTYAVADQALARAAEEVGKA